LLVREATAYKERREELGAKPPKPVTMLASIANARIPEALLPEKASTSPVSLHRDR
jgi:hypothetical protein